MTGVVQRFVAQDLPYTYQQFGDSRGVLMGHRTTHPMARYVARQLARQLTATVAPKSNTKPTSNSFPDNNLGTSPGTVGWGPWVSASVAAWVADGVASEGGATLRFALAPDQAPVGTGPRRGSLPLRLREPQPRLASDTADRVLNQPIETTIGHERDFSMATLSRLGSSVASIHAFVTAATCRLPLVLPTRGEAHMLS